MSGDVAAQTRHARSGDVHIAYQVVGERAVVQELGIEVRAGLHTGDGRLFAVEQGAA